MPRIHFAKVQRTRIESTVSTNGKVEPAEWAAARTESAGVVRAISVQRGETVSRGQTLVRLDVAAAESDLAAAQAKQQEAQAESEIVGQGGKASQLANIADSIRTQQAVVEAAQRNYDSLQRLAAVQAATKLQVQSAKDALDRAKLQLSALEDQRRTLVTTNDKAVAQAKLHDAQAAVALARHRIDVADIRAPISGTVYQFDIKVGAYLQPGELVIKKGDPGDGLFFVLSGSLRARLVVGFEDRTLARIPAGEVFGEMAMFTQSPRSADVVAEEESRMLRL